MRRDRSAPIRGTSCHERAAPRASAQKRAMRSERLGSGQAIRLAGRGRAPGLRRRSSACSAGRRSGAQRATSDRAMLLQQRRLQRNPYDAGSYHRLADAYIQKARETGDMSYFDLAERALGKSSRSPEERGRVRISPSSLLPSRFRAGGRPGQAGLEIDPADGDAHGVLGDALLELGRYDEAEAAYLRMVRDQARSRIPQPALRMKTLRGDPAARWRTSSRQSTLAWRAVNREKASPGPSGSWGRNTSRSVT